MYYPDPSQIECLSNKPTFVLIAFALWFLQFTIPIVIQLFNFTVAWINDKDVKQNQWFKFVFEKMDEKRYDIEAIVFGYFALGMIVIVPLLTAILYFYNITMWLVLAYGLAYVVRASRRLQKKLVKHMEDKKAHE